MQRIRLVLFICCLLLSCEIFESVPESYSGKNIDAGLVGTWCRSFSGRDFHNGITVYTDTICFSQDNTGTRITFSFSGIFNFFCFRFYTEDNLIILRPEGMEDTSRLNYYIRNDSLFIPTFGIPYVKNLID
jgi:hypothetical protein